MKKETLLAMLNAGIESGSSIEEILDVLGWCRKTDTVHNGTAPILRRKDETICELDGSKFFHHGSEKTMPRAACARLLIEQAGEQGIERDVLIARIEKLYPEPYFSKTGFRSWLSNAEHGTGPYGVFYSNSGKQFQFYNGRYYSLHIVIKIEGKPDKDD